MVIGELLDKFTRYIFILILFLSLINTQHAGIVVTAPLFLRRIDVSVQSTIYNRVLGDRCNQ
ncbi:MAG: hypothetical protein PHT07_16865, partial [Paludibacter sp.]|nr:hypothetical protein [Paludibacter sp.]